MNPEDIIRKFALSILAEKRLRVSSDDSATSYVISVQTVERNHGRLLGKLGSNAQSLREVAAYISPEIRIVIESPADDIDKVKDEHEHDLIEDFMQTMLDAIEEDTFEVIRNGRDSKVTIRHLGDNELEPRLKVAIEKLFFSAARIRQDYIEIKWEDEV